MNEIAETESSKEIKDLQVELGKWVSETHKLAHEAFGKRGRFVARGTHNSERIEELASKIFRLDFLYERIPEGFHLKAGLTPLAAQGLQDREDTKPLVQVVEFSRGPEYQLEVGRRAFPEDIKEPNRKILNFRVVGTTDPSGAEKTRLDLVFVSKEVIRDTGVSLYPEEVLSMEIVPDKRF